MSRERLVLSLERDIMSSERDLCRGNEYYVEGGEILFSNLINLSHYEPLVAVKDKVIS